MPHAHSIIGRWFLLVGVALGLLGCASASWTPAPVEDAWSEAPVGEAPLLVDNDLPLTPVTIDGQGPYLFVVDTGASVSALDHTLIRRLGYDEQAGETATIHGVAGETETRTFTLDSLRVAHQLIADVRVVAADLSPFPGADTLRYGGILGHDVLQEFDISYNLADRSLALYPHEEERADEWAAADSLHRIPFRNQGTDLDVITLDLTLRDQRVEGVLDTGSRNSVLNWTAAGLKGIKQDTVSTSHETIGFSGTPAPTYVHSFDSLYVDSLRFQAQRASVTELPVLEGPTERPAMLVGNNMLRDRVVKIAYSRRELYVSTPQSDP